MRSRYSLILLLITASLFNGYLIPIKIGGNELDLRPDQIVVMICLGIIFFGNPKKGFSIYRTELDIPILAMLGINLLSSIFFSPIRSFSLRSVALLSVYMSMYFITTQVLVPQPIEKLRRLIGFFLNIGLIEAGFGILILLLYAAGIQVPGIQIGQTRSSVSIAGTFYEANLLGIYLSIIGTFFVGFLLLQRSGSKTQFILFAKLILICAALAMTLTRSAWGAFAFCSAIILAISAQSIIQRYRIRKHILIILVSITLSLLVILVILNPLISKISGMPNLLGQRIQGGIKLTDSSIIGRLTSFNLAWSRWQERPIFGWGTFGYEDMLHNWFNSSLVQALHDTGIIGLVLMLWMHFRIISISWKTAHLVIEPVDRIVLLSLCLGNLTIFLTSQTSSFLWVGFPWVFMGITMAYIHSIRRNTIGIHSRGSITGMHSVE
jgi:O-antigen ligase